MKIVFSSLFRSQDKRKKKNEICNDRVCQIAHAIGVSLKDKYLNRNIVVKRDEKKMHILSIIANFFHRKNKSLVLLSLPEENELMRQKACDQELFKKMGRHEIPNDIQLPELCLASSYADASSRAFGASYFLYEGYKTTLTEKEFDKKTNFLVLDEFNCEKFYTFITFNELDKWEETKTQPNAMQPDMAEIETVSISSDKELLAILSKNTETSLFLLLGEYYERAKPNLKTNLSHSAWKNKLLPTTYFLTKVNNSDDLPDETEDPESEKPNETSDGDIFCNVMGYAAAVKLTDAMNYFHGRDIYIAPHDDKVTVFLTLDKMSDYTIPANSTLDNAHSELAKLAIAVTNQWLLHQSKKPGNKFASAGNGAS